ncbi:unnamed protein product, partial [Ectocarpus fasciculatus]
AFVVALDQACEGGEKRWYTSTLELQLASPVFCKACRSVSTLNVLVETATPRTLWASRALDSTTSEVSSSSVSSRVPLVRAFSLTWRLSSDVVQQVSSTPKLMTFERYVGESIMGVVWPASLQELSLGFNFNQPIAEFVWPASLQHLS